MSMTATVSRLDSFRYWRGNEEATTEDWLKDISAPPNHRMDVGAAFQTVLENMSVGGEFTDCSANGFSFNFKCDAAIPQLNPVYGRKQYDKVLVSGRAGLVDGKRVEVFKTTKRFDAEKRLDDYQWRLYLDLFDADEFVWNIFAIAPNNPDETSYDVVGYHRLTATRYAGLHADCVSLVNDYYGIMSSIQEENTIMASTGRGTAKALPREVEMLTIHGDIVQETEDAILVDCGAGEAVWLPKSQIEYSGERDDCDVKISVPDWLAEEKGLHDGQSKTRTTPTDAPADGQADGQADDQTPAPAEPAPACHFKGDVSSLDAESIVLTVTSTKGKEKAFTFGKDALRFEGDDVADLQVGYKGIDFVLGWDMAVESGLAKHLKLKAPNPAPEAAQQEAQAAATATTTAEPEVDDDEAPQTKTLKSKLRTETVRATVELTSEEKNECAKRITDALSSRTSLKEKASYYSSKAREAEKEAYKASEVFESGEEERDITCDVIGDFNTMELVYVESEWPHREIQRRHMTDKDRQLLLPIDKPKKPQPEHEDVAAAPVEQGAIEACEEIPRICETCARFNEDQAAPECADCHADASLPQWLEPEQEPETVTLYGEVLDQRKTETVFRVHYGDDKNTVAEFTIPNEQFQPPAFADPASTQDFITLTLAYAVEAGIVAAPENEVSVNDAMPYHPTCETCAHNDTNSPDACDKCVYQPEADTADDSLTNNWEAIAVKDARACASCTHLDAAADDNACEGCGDDLSNFTSIEQHQAQGQGASVGAAQ